MTSADIANDYSDDFWTALEGLQSRIDKSKAVNVNVESLREETRSLVKKYFSDLRPRWRHAGVSTEKITVVDAASQELLSLANGANKRVYFRKQLRIVRGLRPSIEMELALGSAKTPASQKPKSYVEERIIATLSELLPSASLSYQQVLNDLRESRISYRGTAVELRETLREVLDQLAPDKEVSSENGFRLEQDAKKPTMRQKALFVLKARSVPRNAMKPTENSIEMAEEISARMARSVYEKSSISTHVMTDKHEVARIKMFIDGVLVELLQIPLD